MTGEIVAIVASSIVALGCLSLLWLMQRQLAVTLRDLTHAVVAKQDPDAARRYSQVAVQSAELNALREARVELQQQNGALNGGFDEVGFLP